MSCLQISFCFDGEMLEVENLSETSLKIFPWLPQTLESYPLWHLGTHITWNADTRSWQRPSVILVLPILLIFYFRTVFCPVKCLRQRHLTHFLNGFRLLMDLSNKKVNDFQILSAQSHPPPSLGQGETQTGSGLRNLTAQWLYT